MTAEGRKVDRADGRPVCWRSAVKALRADVRNVVLDFAAKCPGLDQEELTSFLLVEGGVALVKAYSTPSLWCEPGAYAGTAIRRKAGTYVHKMRTAASFKEWDLRKHYDHLVANNQRYTAARAQAKAVTALGANAENTITEAEALERVVLQHGQVPQEEDPAVEAALARIRELIERRPVAVRVLLNGESMAQVARDLGCSVEQVRLEQAATRTALSRDGVLRELVRLLGVGLARDVGRPWTLACVAVGSGTELPVDWPEPPEYDTPEQAWDAAERMERAYYARDPDATIEVKFVARRARGVEAP